MLWSGGDRHLLLPEEPKALAGATEAGAPFETLPGELSASHSTTGATFGRHCLRSSPSMTSLTSFWPRTVLNQRVRWGREERRAESMQCSKTRYRLKRRRGFMIWTFGIFRLHTPDICHFFTQAKFLENKIYTEKRVNYDKIHRKLPTFALLRQNTQ